MLSERQTEVVLRESLGLQWPYKGQMRWCAMMERPQFTTSQSSPWSPSALPLTNFQRLSAVQATVTLNVSGVILTFVNPAFSITLQIASRSMKLFTDRGR